MALEEKDAAGALRLAQERDPLGAFERMREVFFVAVTRGNAESALALLAAEPRLAFAEHAGAPSLHWVCAEARLEPLIEPLLSAGCDAMQEAREESRGSIALEWAAQSGNLAAVSALLALRPERHSMARMNQSLREAARKGFGDVCLFLMARGADPLEKGVSPINPDRPKKAATPARQTIPGAIKAALGRAQMSLPWDSKDDGDSLLAEPRDACALDLLVWRLKAFPDGPSREKGLEALAVMEACDLRQSAGAEKPAAGEEGREEAGGSKGKTGRAKRL